MDTDTLREKFIRSEEALIRLGDDTKQLIFSRVQDFKSIKEYLDTLIKEKEAVDAQITEKEAKIATHQNEINSQANLKEELLNRHTQLKEELQAKESRLEDLNNEKAQTSDKINVLNDEIAAMKTSISQRKEQISALTRNIADLEAKFAAEIESTTNKTAEISQTIEKLQNENSIISFLLEESAEDIPEVDILAAVMQLGKISKEELKTTLKDQISPVLITRTLGRMAEKGLLKYDESNDIISI
ncbi:MAG: hypothetical protein EAX86_00715 [Candidatus Heimdallarchaeota archaeon]|nr:hypothetical protein [Candidatus Heimdallarchaeota archaeon]